MLNTGLIFDFVCKDDKFDNIIETQIYRNQMRVQNNVIYLFSISNT